MSEIYFANKGTTEIGQELVARVETYETHLRDSGILGELRGKRFITCIFQARESGDKMISARRSKSSRDLASGNSVSSRTMAA
jgi:hypothetical protein